MPKKNENTNENIENNIIEKFSKTQIVNSKRFKENRDLLNAILEDNYVYTLDEIEVRIKEFKKGKV